MLLGGDELIAGAYPALKGFDVGSGLLDRVDSRRAHRFVRLESIKPRVRDLSLFMAEIGYIKVVLDSVGRNDDITDVDLIIQRTGNAGVDDLCTVKIVDQRVRADTGIHLAHTALDDDDRFFSQLTFTELHLRDLLRFCDLRGFLEGIDLHIHRADDTDLLFFCFIGGIAFCAPRQQGNRKDHQCSDERKYLFLHVIHLISISFVDYGSLRIISNHRRSC